MGGIQRYVPEPTSDSVDVNTCSEQMAGCRMSNRVRTYPFGSKRRHRGARPFHCSADQSVDAESSHWLPETIQKYPFVGGTRAHLSLEQTDGFWPERTMPCLVAFPCQTNVTRTSPGQITDGDLCGLCYARTGIVEELEDRVITCSLFGSSIRRLQDRIHLGLFQIGHRGLGRFPKWNGAGLGAPRHMLRAVGADEL